MSIDPSKSRRLRVGLKTFLIVSLTLGAWTGTQLRWLYQRREARAWLAAQEKSWYAPSLVGAKTQASAPWSLRIVGEQGVVGIGIDEAQDSAEMPYGTRELSQLFPEARVDRSRNGRFLDDQE